MKNTEIVFRKICAFFPDWNAGIEDELDNTYSVFSQIGRELIHDFDEGRNIPRLKEVMKVVEELLQDYQNDTDVTSLIGLGLLEGMHSPSLKSKQPDKVLDLMGKKTAAFFVDLLEGWAGTGIRSLDQLRRKFLGGILSSIVVEIDGEDQKFRIRLDVEKYEGGLPHLLMEKRIDKSGETGQLQSMGLQQPFGKITVTSQLGIDTILVGNRVIANAEDRFALCNEEVMVINLEKYLSGLFRWKVRYWS